MSHFVAIVSLFENLERNLLLQVFTSLSLLNMLIVPINAIPWVLNGVIEAWVSVKRVSSYLLVIRNPFRNLLMI